MCLALAVTGFVVCGASASAARSGPSHRIGAHRAIGHPHGLRFHGLRPGKSMKRRAHERQSHERSSHERRAGSSHHGRRAHFAGTGHRRSLYAAAHRHGFARLARRLVDAPASYGGGQTGKASFYGGSHRTANGGFIGAATCAHRTLPFGTKVLVTNLNSGRQAVLTVNDRGPFVRGRIVDVSRGAASTLGMIASGTASVRVQVVSRGAEGSVW